MDKTFLIDSHCHLQDERYGDLDGVIDRAQNVGVKKFLCNGTDTNDWDKLYRLSQKYEEIIPAYGAHPWYIDNLSEDWEGKLVEYLDKSFSTVGEIGLDRTVDGNIKKQIDVFERQLQIARDKKRAVSIHCRKSWDILTPILKRYKTAEFNILIHSFSGSPEVINQLNDIGVYYSFSGSITNLNNLRALEAVKYAPLDRILIETDSPDIPPTINGIYDKNLLNEPSNLQIILNRVAEIRNLEIPEIKKQIQANFMNFINKSVKILR